MVCAHICRSGLLREHYSCFSFVVGSQFLPSTYWAKVTYFPRIVIAAIMCLHGLHLFKKNAEINERIYGKFKRAFIIIVSPLLCYGFAALTLTATFPMKWALFASETVEIEFVVDNPNRRNRKYCRRSISLEGLPPGLDRICGVTEDFASRLEAGSKIVVIGQGTSIGVFPRRLREFQADH
ncbi:hypothetical protein CLV88_110141 [Shimia abyssi]|uniref:Uncharacterized protein n=2 Tax=Shimia abyssi TaxID=1662395 RepID=A0A2P8FA25_9RHOB|nr:hypothetical protein CLV88_110141 [Shimia abyssi]